MSVQADANARRIALTVIVASVVALGMTAIVGVTPSLAQRFGWSTGTSGDYAAGELIDLPRAVYEKSDRTVLLFASSTCGACARSKATVRMVVSDLRAAATGFMLLTPTAMRSDQEAFAEGLDLRADEHLAVDFKALRLKSVPTVVVVDRSGRVLYAKEGLIDESGRTAIRGALGLPRL
jgi:thioredoxin-related protein